MKISQKLLKQKKNFVTRTIKRKPDIKLSKVQDRVVRKFGQKLGYRHLQAAASKALVGHRVIVTKDSYGVAKGTKGLVVDASLNEVIIAFSKPTVDVDGYGDFGWTNEKETESFGAPITTRMKYRLFVYRKDVKVVA